MAFIPFTLSRLIFGKTLSLQLPSFLLDQLDLTPGFDRDAFIAAHQVPAPVSLRQHPFKKGALPAPVLDNVPWCPEGHYLAQRPLFTADPLFHAGSYYVQEASSMFLQEVLRQLYPVPARLNILDLCAAPGGKSTLLASWMSRDSLLVSNEVIRSRASVLEENMIRWGYMNTWVCSNDPRDIGRMGGYFDLVVTDAPCSGSGLFRKDPEALREWSPSQVQLCSERQQRILADIWPALKRDGYLIYATCSYSPDEDEQVLDRLASDCELESISLDIPAEWGIAEVRSRQHKCYGYRFFPDKVRGEGFFIAVVRKKEGEAHFPYPRFRTAHQKAIAAQAKALLQPGDYALLEQGSNRFIAIPADREADLQVLKQFVFLRRTGLALGMPSLKEWVPEHDLALGLDSSKDIPRLELDKGQALQYLQKGAPELGITLKGWYIVNYQGQGLGWIKALGNRVNNYLPKHWRIRMNLDRYGDTGADMPE